MSSLLAELNRDIDEYSQQNAINTLTHLDALAEIPDTWVKETLKNPKAGQYLRRLAKRLIQKRR